MITIESIESLIAAGVTINSFTNTTLHRRLEELRHARATEAKLQSEYALAVATAERNAAKPKITTRRCSSVPSSDTDVAIYQSDGGHHVFTDAAGLEYRAAGHLSFVPRERWDAATKRAETSEGRHTLVFDAGWVDLAAALAHASAVAAVRRGNRFISVVDPSQIVRDIAGSAPVTVLRRMRTASEGHIREALELALFERFGEERGSIPRDTSRAEAKGAASNVRAWGEIAMQAIEQENAVKERRARINAQIAAEDAAAAPTPDGAA